MLVLLLSQSLESCVFVCDSTKHTHTQIIISVSMIETNNNKCPVVTLQVKHSKEGKGNGTN